MFGLIDLVNSYRRIKQILMRQVNREWWIDWLVETTFEFLQSPRIGSSFIAVMNDEAKTPISHSHDPLHGITLKNILNQLVQRHGWSEMGRRVPVRCFQFNPTVKSSLTFLRKTPWARKRVEDWFIGELLPKKADSR